MTKRLLLLLIQFKLYAIHVLVCYDTETKTKMQVI